MNATTIEKTDAKVTSTSATPQVQQAEDSRPDFGNTRYSRFADEVYRDSIRILHLNKQQAERLARSAMADIGTALARSSVDIKVGAMKKSDATFTIREVASMKNIVATHSIVLCKLMQQLQDCVKLGLLFKQSTFDLAPNIVAWLNKE